MKSIFSTLLLLLILMFSETGYAQSLDTGKNLYQNGDYERAIRVFSNIDEPEAILFIGKSYFALGQYLKSKSYLDLILQEEQVNEPILTETTYTKALVLFQLDDFSASLSLLYQLKENNTNNTFKSRATTFYNQVVSYLSINQIKTVFRQNSNQEILKDVLDGSLGRISYSKAKVLLDTFKSSLIDANTVDLLQIESALKDSLTYSSRYPYRKYSKTPNGMSYQIGVALPSFEIQSDNYEVSQHLYFGIQLAVEEFNSNQPNKKAFLNFVQTNSNSVQPADILNKLIWDKDVDVVIGPLFSEVAKAFSGLAEEYEIPVITPLANSDSLSLANNYMFQTNPTFSVQGTKMAQYAVNELGIDTVAILAQQNALGKTSALAFRHEAERLGAFVQHSFLEDLQSNGYDISEYTAYLSKTDLLMPTSGLKAVYAPFTGSAAPTLIRNLITDLEASESDYILLGSEEWSNIDIASTRLPETSLHYTQSFDIRYGDNDVENFVSNFRLRFEAEPNQFAFIGFDVANAVLSTLNRVGNPSYLKNGLHELKNFRGLSNNIEFSSEHINQKVIIKSIYRNE